MTYICVLISKLPWTPRDFWTACTHDKSFYMLPFIFQFRNIFYKKNSKFNIFSFVLLNAAQGERTRGVANFSYIFSARLVENSSSLFFGLARSLFKRFSIEFWGKNKRQICFGELFWVGFSPVFFSVPFISIREYSYTKLYIYPSYPTLWLRNCK